MVLKEVYFGGGVDVVKDGEIVAGIVIGMVARNVTRVEELGPFQAWWPA